MTAAVIMKKMIMLGERERIILKSEPNPTTEKKKKNARERERGGGKQINIKNNKQSENISYFIN